ncbi:MAG TPA: hypothetical protein VGF45_06310 [Polyangia bacterium]
MDAFVIPPLLLYAFGAVLAVMGGLRAYFLGWKQRPDVPEEADDEPAAQGQAGPDAPEPQDGDDGSEIRGEVRGRGRGTWSDGKRSSQHKRHLAMGVIWMLLGLFLIISTAVQG